MNHSVDLEVSEARGAIFNSFKQSVCKNNKKRTYKVVQVKNV